MEVSIWEQDDDTINRKPAVCVSVRGSESDIPENVAKVYKQVRAELDKEEKSE